MDRLSSLQAVCEENPPFNSGFLFQKDSYLEPGFFYYPEQIVKQTVELSVISDAITYMQHHCIDKFGH